MHLERGERERDTTQTLVVDIENLKIFLANFSYEDFRSTKIAN